MDTRGDDTRHITVHDDVGLDSFFARPISIYTLTLTPGSAFAGASINPWQLFMTNNRVSNRMSNYRLFSGNLCLKVMINGNSFYYGRYMVSYAPYWQRDVAFAGTALGSASSLMQNSQRLKIFVDPSESQAGHLRLPFLWHTDMLDLTNSDYTELGAVSIEELVTLKHANGAVSPITMTIFAWMENVKLSAPTVQDIVGITAQAGDEYGSTPVSAAASAVSRASGALTSIPVIGPYMKATSMASGAMSSVAKMFGYSRPVNLETSISVKQRPIGELAATDTPDGSVKLTVDSKQELSVDPAIVGLSGEDDLALKRIASRETYATSFTWTTAGTTNTSLYNIRVKPQYGVTSTGTLGTIYTIPACAFAVLPFKYWRGTMRYRFMIVASAYHKGRLKFVWDPVAHGTSTETNVQYTKIVDISNERDFVIDCAWGNPRAWLPTANANQFSAVNTMRTAAYSSATDANGVLNVSVLNELTTPNSSINNDITVLIFMSMCDDAEFAAPNNQIESLSIYDPTVQTQSGYEVITPQGDIEGDPLEDNNAPEAMANTEEYIPCNPLTDNSLLVYMGESVNSFRQLIKRYAVDYHYANIAPGIYQHVTSDFPMKYGYTFNGLRGTSTNKYDNCTTTMMRYCAMAFLFYRGGTRRKYMFSSNSTTPQFGAMIIERRGPYGTSAPTTTALTITSATTISDGMRSATPTGTQGMAVTTLRQNQIIEAELPFYKDVRFALCRRLNSYPTFPGSTTIPFVEDLCHTFNCNVWTPATANVYTSFVSAAEDSTFMCFQGCAPFYIAPTLV